MLKAARRQESDGSQPDDLVTTFRRDDMAIVLGFEDLNGTAFPRRVSAALKDISDTQHWRSKMVSDLSTVMAFCRLPDGEKLKVLVTSKDYEGETSESVGIRGFWSLVDKDQTVRVTLANQMPVVINLEGAKVYDTIVNYDSDGGTILESAVLVGGNQTYSIKTTVSPLSCGSAPSYEIKEIRSGIPFRNSVKEGTYCALNLLSCAGRKEFQSQERELFLTVL